MGKQAKAEAKDILIRSRAQRIAEATVRARAKEETMSDEERKELLKTVYEEQLKRLREEADTERSRKHGK